MFLVHWLFRGLIKLLGVVAQVAVLLLVKLGLWVPLFFAFGWLLICASNKIPLNDPAALNVLAAGFIISVIVGVAGTVYFRQRRRENERRENEARKEIRVQKSKYTGSIIHAAQLPNTLPISWNDMLSGCGTSRIGNG